MRRRGSPRFLASSEVAEYGRATGVLGLGVGLFGILVYVFFALCSRTLPTGQYGEIVLAWSAAYVIAMSGFRPVELLLSRSVTAARARGEPIGEALRAGLRVGAITLAVVALLALAAAVGLAGPLFDGDYFLCGAAYATVLAAAIGFICRGVLVGEGRFFAYSTVLVIEGIARIIPVGCVAVGVGGERLAVLALPIGPTVGLIATVWILVGRRRAPSAAASAPAFGGPGPVDRAGSVGSTAALGAGSIFASGLFALTLAEQVLVNAGPILVGVRDGAAAAGLAFNILILGRAPIVVFQAVGLSLMPHLTRLGAAGRSSREIDRSLRLTLVGVLGFTAFLGAIVAVAGPELMQVALGAGHTYRRLDLLIVVVGMGLYLTASTINQAAIAGGRVTAPALAWLAGAAGFCGCVAVAPFDPLRALVFGFAATGGFLAMLSALLHRRATAASRRRQSSR